MKARIIINVESDHHEDLGDLEMSVLLRTDWVDEDKLRKRKVYISSIAVHREE